MVNPAMLFKCNGSEIAPRRARSKEFLIKKYSELCELGGSVVNTSSQ